jgi:hypothetical protein
MVLAYLTDGPALNITPVPTAIFAITDVGEVV